MESLLNPNRGGKRLPRATTDYLFLRKTTIKSEFLRQAKRATQTAFKRSRQDPVFQILQIFAFLRGPISFTRAQVGEQLRELHRLLATVIAPLDPGNDQLAANLSSFGLLVRHYPDELHDSEVVDYLMDVYYGYHLRRGNYRLCLDVALRAAQRYREFSEPRLLPRLAGALDKAATCAESLHEDETARPLLQEAIGVYKKLVDVDPKGKQVQIHQFKVLLARTLVRYCHVVCRLRPELAAHWTKDALDALREAIKIYSTARTFGQSGPAKYSEELEDALLDLVIMARRKGDREEAAEAEARLRRLREEEHV
ncbi:hypothetical protein FRC05_000437 [Tulasnella sp. 425]|nr:hypothetical protein FRC05_000437 [Tulasnella sp. 425]